VQAEWELSATPKQIMLFHTLHANEALVNLKSKLVRKLVEGAIEKEFEPLEYLFHQDDDGDGMYIVEEGTCIVLKKDKEKEESNDSSHYLEVARIQIGSIIGEMVSYSINSIPVWIFEYVSQE
jgi:CRP-like cAMP-binding protein